MASFSFYGTVPFGISAADGMASVWTRPVFVARKSVPYSDFEVTQFTGRGNSRVAVQAQFASQSAYEAMREMAGDGVARGLTQFFGQDHASVYLVNFSGGRTSLASSGYFVAEIEFEQAAPA